MLRSKRKAITWMWSLIRVESCGLVRNGCRGQVTLREKEPFITNIIFLPSNKGVMFSEEEETLPKVWCVCIYTIVLVGTCLCLFSCLTHWVNKLGLNFL